MGTTRGIPKYNCRVGGDLVRIGRRNAGLLMLTTIWLRSCRGYTVLLSQRAPPFRRRGLQVTTRWSSNARRLAEYDSMFFEEPSTRRPIPTPRNYDPEDEDLPNWDTTTNIDNYKDDYPPPQSSAWDDIKPQSGGNHVETKGTSQARATVQENTDVKLRQPQRFLEEGLNKQVGMIPTDRRNVYLKTLQNGDSGSMSVEQLTERMNDLESRIFEQNNGERFNINSPKQVAMVLFGDSKQSTNKDSLEALGAAGNLLADLIVQYRQRKQEIKRMESKASIALKGKKVLSVSKTVTNSSNDPLLLVDASAYIFRAYFSMPPLHRSDGMPIGAVMGFCNMMNRLTLTRLLNGERPRFVLVYDSKGSNFRHTMYPEYKANRPECPIDLIPQFDLVRQAASAYGIPGIDASGYEADDVIATLATKALSEGVDTHILSSDKDLMQLVTSPEAAPYIHMIDPFTMSRVDHDAVLEKWGVPPEKIGDVLALAGDNADNIPGIPGIGPKIAAALLDEFGSLDGIYERISDIKQPSRREKLLQHKDLAFLSQNLVKLEKFIPMDQLISTTEIGNVDDLRMEDLDGDRILTFYHNMGFKTLYQKVQDRLERMGKTNLKAKPKGTPRQRAQIPKPEEYQDVPF